MTGTLPPAPPEDDDRERKWIIEGLRQALARATVDELARLTSLLEPEADGSGNVAGWLVLLVADEAGRQHAGGLPDPASAASEESDEAPGTSSGAPEDNGKAPGRGSGAGEESDEAPGTSVAEDNGEAPEPGLGLALAERSGEAPDARAGTAQENGDAQPAGLSGRAPRPRRPRR
jgi:hypothetical protein